MVLISIRPFAFRKIFLLAATLFCLSSALCVADSLFMSLHSGPYGHQANRLQSTPLSVPVPTVPPVARISPVGINFDESGPDPFGSIYWFCCTPGGTDALAGGDHRSYTPLWPADWKCQTASSTAGDPNNN